MSLTVMFAQTDQVVGLLAYQDSSMVEQINRAFKAIVITMAFLIILPLLADEEATNPASHKIYFSLADEFGIPETTAQEVFDCTDKIYTVLELENYPQEKYQLSVKWIDPHNETRENTQYPFTARKGNTKLWAWLSLSRATGAGMLQFINPAAGLDEFIGVWTIEVRIDNKLIETGSFEVSC